MLFKCPVCVTEDYNVDAFNLSSLEFMKKLTDLWGSNK